MAVKYVITKQFNCTRVLSYIRCTIYFQKVEMDLKFSELESETL